MTIETQPDLRLEALSDLRQQIEEARATYDARIEQLIHSHVRPEEYAWAQAARECKRGRDHAYSEYRRAMATIRREERTV